MSIYRKRQTKIPENLPPKQLPIYKPPEKIRNPNFGVSIQLKCQELQFLMDD